jgi:hypothetical protein
VVRGSIPCLPPSRWRLCVGCGGQVDTRWWALGHAIWCFPRELREGGETALAKFYQEATYAR